MFLPVKFGKLFYSVDSSPWKFSVKNKTVFSFKLFPSLKH